MLTLVVGTEMAVVGLGLVILSRLRTRRGLLEVTALFAFWVGLKLLVLR